MAQFEMLDTRSGRRVSVAVHERSTDTETRAAALDLLRTSYPDRDLDSVRITRLPEPVAPVDHR